MGGGPQPLFDLESCLGFFYGLLGFCSGLLRVFVFWVYFFLKVFVGLFFKGFCRACLSLFFKLVFKVFLGFQGFFFSFFFLSGLFGFCMVFSVSFGVGIKGSPDPEP